MTKPHYQKQHDYWVEDIIFFESQKEFFITTAIKYPNDKKWHKIIDGLKKLIRAEKRRYKETYGEVFQVHNVDVKTLIEWIYKSGYKPNKWEEDFMEDILNLPWKLNPKQTACLEKIYEKATGGGVYQNKEKL